MDLHDKVIVVTGASSGIGDAIARELSAAGARLLITARRAERLAALAAALPGPCATLAAAIQAPDTAQRLLDLALAQYGHVDGLINNAGLFVAGSVDTIDLDELAQMTRVNFDRLRAQGQPVRAGSTPPLAPAMSAGAVRFMLEHPARANVARMLLVSSAESA